jgi:hypothetical protein
MSQASTRELVDALDNMTMDHLRGMDDELLRRIDQLGENWPPADARSRSGRPPRKSAGRGGLNPLRSFPAVRPPIRPFRGTFSAALIVSLPGAISRSRAFIRRAAWPR